MSDGLHVEATQSTQLLADFNAIVKNLDTLIVADRPGIYGDFDGRLLYGLIRRERPASIVEFGIREGKSSSITLRALIDNLEQHGCKFTYYMFEKDQEYYDDMVRYVKAKLGRYIDEEQAGFKHDKNIIGSKLLADIGTIDFLFIDGNHDYILAKWYIDVLFPMVRPGGFIHIHDIVYDTVADCINDSRTRHTHLDYSDHDTIQALYPDGVFEHYCEEDPTTVKQWEPSVIKEYLRKTMEPFVCTSAMEGSGHFACALYLQKSPTVSAGANER